MKMLKALVLAQFALAVAPALADITVTPTSGRQNLPHCGGTIEGKAARNGDMNLVFRDVIKCDRFDIVEASGGWTNGSEDSRLQSNNGVFHGSRTIPQRLIDSGRNYVKIKLHGFGRYDYIHVHFRADRDGDVLPTNPRATLPLPTQPRGGFPTTQACRATVTETTAAWADVSGYQYAGVLARGAQIVLASYDTVAFRHGTFGMRLAQVYVVSNPDFLNTLAGRVVSVPVNDTNLRERCGL